MDNRKLIIGLCVVGLLFALIVVATYSIQFWGTFENASTQDFANFGTYFSGVLMPIVTAASVVFLGLQYKASSTNNRTTSENNKQATEANLKLAEGQEKIRLVNTLELHITKLKEFVAVDTDDAKTMKGWITSLADKAEYHYRKGSDVHLEFKEEYNYISRVIHSFQVVLLTLNQIRNLEEREYTSGRSKLFSEIDRILIRDIERVRFFRCSGQLKLATAL
ncbi:hypothetical protein ACPV5W_17670 [Vibrio astriarenae]